MNTYKIGCGDCLQLMQDIPDGSVDMVLCDLPYGTTQCKWDTVIPFEPMWEQYKRVLAPDAPVVLFGSQPFTSALVMSNLKWFRQALVWSKNKSSGHLNAKRRHMTAHEDILLFSSGTCLYVPQMTETGVPANRANRRKSSTCYGSETEVSEYSGGNTYRYPTTVLRFPVVNNDSTNELKTHPTQKPVALMEYLIRTYTNEGDLVLDNCMGSGTTGVACINTGRSFIGFEKDADYFNIAHDRISAALRGR